MFIKYIFIFFFFAFCVQANTQGILDQIVWADEFRGNWNSIFNPEVETDEDGNILFGVTFLGYMNNVIEWRGDTIVKEDSLLGKRVFFLTKLDPDGNLLWHVILKGQSAVNMQELKVDHDNNVIILLQASHSFDAFQQTFEAGYNLLKLDKNGELLWSERIIRASISNAGHALSIACNNDIILGGSIGKVRYDSVVVEIIGYDTIFSYLYKYVNLIIDGQEFAADTHNIFLVRLNPEGHVIWFRTFEHTGGLALNAIDGSSPFGIALLGYYLHEDWAIFNTILPIDTIGYYHKFNMFILTLNEDGEFKWINNYFNNAMPTHIRYDYSGNIIVLGHIPTSTYYQLDTISNINNSGSLLLFKVDSLGTYLWGQNTGGQNTSDGGQMAINSSDEIYLAGRGLSNFIGRLLNKYTSEGQQLWSVYPQSNSNRRSEDISLDRSGNLIMAGYYSGKLDLGDFSFEFIGSTYRNFIVKFKSELDSITPSSCEFLTQVEDVQRQQEVFYISPNPATDRIQVELSSFQTPVVINVFDAQGKCIYGTKLSTSFPSSIDISKWPAGNYLIRAESSKSALIRQFIKVH